MKKHPAPRASRIVPIILIEILIGSVLACFSFILFFDLSHRVLSEDFMVFDLTIMNAVYAMRSPLITQLMLFLTFLGGSVALVSASAAIFLVLLRRGFRYEAALFGVTIVMGVFLNLLFKYVIARARPDIAPIIQEVFYSFPSGHSMNAFIFYALLAFLTYRFTHKLLLSSAVTVVCALLILGIGISRVYLGVHYPSDVLAGFLAGLGWFLTIIVIDRTFRVYRSYTRT